MLGVIRSRAVSLPWRPMIRCTYSSVPVNSNNQSTPQEGSLKQEASPNKDEKIPESPDIKPDSPKQENQQNQQAHQDPIKDKDNAEEEQKKSKSWWSSLPIVKKIIYGGLLGCAVPSLVYLIYEGNLKTTYPYKMTFNKLKVSSEVQAIYGNIEEGRWYKDILWGRVSQDSGGYPGKAFLHLPFSGDKGRSGTVDIEAIKYGCGPLRWKHTYMKVTNDDGTEMVFLDKRNLYTNTGKETE